MTFLDTIYKQAIKGYGLCFVLLILVLAGCNLMSDDRPMSQKFGWKAEDFFTDAKVVDLIRAIEKNDLEEMKRLLVAGADANAKGKDNNTPLLWAFLDNKPERFKLLLEHGADPNVTFLSDFGTKTAIHKGNAVTHLAAESWFPEQFALVMKHGADPNLKDYKEETPLFSVIMGRADDKKARIQLLIDAGADLNHMSQYSGQNALSTAVGWFGQYDLALMLLKAGADPNVAYPNQKSKLIHKALRERSKIRPEESKPHLEELIQWLADHGQNVEEAEADIRRWRAEREK